MSSTDASAPLPLVDLCPLLAGEASGRDAVAAQIGAACRGAGFFYVVGHGVDECLIQELVSLSREFFALSAEAKLRIRMARGGRAWRGYFPVGGELTAGRPDLKEGLYYGAELGPDHPRVRAGTPLFGPNLFPDEIPALRRAVLAYMDALTLLGHTVMSGIAMSLGLPASYFADLYTGDPFTLFRIFNYPPAASGEGTWGVGEHTDYGLLTLLLQDDAGGLEVRTRDGWVEAPPIAGSFVCNLGDMLDRMTGGLYRSSPHRVRNRAPRDRMSFPFFFDPSFDAEVRPIPLPGTAPLADDAAERWDGASVHAFQGTYGDYLLGKVAKVFPALGEEVL